MNLFPVPASHVHDGIDSLLGIRARIDIHVYQRRAGNI